MKRAVIDYYKDVFKYGNNLLNDKNTLNDGICYILKAPKHEIKEALFKMGKIFYKGILLHQDKRKAANNFIRSAQLQNKLALFYYGLMLFLVMVLMLIK